MKKLDVFGFFVLLFTVLYTILQIVLYIKIEG
jgi:hypothetical protein